MAPLTLRKCFEEEHPVYETEYDAGNDSAKKSSTTVGKQAPPRVLLEVKVDHWIDVADNFLQSSIAKKDDYFNTNFAMPPGDDGVVVKADVVRIAGRHLIDPLMAGLRAKFPTQLKQYAEQNVQTLRVDVAIKTRPPRNIRAVVLLEYKRCEYIRNSEFENALRTGDIKEEIRKLDNNNQYCTLGNNNALKFVRQATAYHVRTQCKYVAICDYNSLILIRYTGRESLESAHITVVPRSDIRKALLGFSIEACEVAGL